MLTWQEAANGFVTKYQTSHVPLYSREGLTNPANVYGFTTVVLMFLKPFDIHVPVYPRHNCCLCSLIRIYSIVIVVKMSVNRDIVVAVAIAAFVVVVAVVKVVIGLVMATYLWH